MCGSLLSLLLVKLELVLCLVWLLLLLLMVVADVVLHKERLGRL